MCSHTFISSNISTIIEHSLISSVVVCNIHFELPTINCIYLYFFKRLNVIFRVSRFMDLCAHSVFVYVVDPLVVLVSVA